MQIKISAKYWQQLQPHEQEYIKERAGKDTIPYMKLVISNARKQHPTFTSIYGKGFIRMPDKTVYLFTGEDTRRFIKIPIQEQIKIAMHEIRTQG